MDIREPRRGSADDALPRGNVPREPAAPPGKQSGAASHAPTVSHTGGGAHAAALTRVNASAQAPTVSHGSKPISVALRQGTTWRRFLRKDVYYYGMLLVPLLYLLLFRYIPMSGNILSFRRFQAGSGIWGAEWVGLKYFNHFLGNEIFWRAFRNNLVLAVMNIAFAFPVPIVFALLLNEVGNLKYKKVVQTVSYLPHFLSVVVVVGMIKEVLSPSTGIVNTVLELLGAEPIFFLTEAEWFRPIYVVSDIWQHMGWNAIIYIAALAGIDEQLYEAAEVDGASRLQQTIHVTLPGISAAVIITLILAVGRMMMIGFEKILLLYNPSIYETADVLSTFVYRMGLQEGNYSYGTAVGLFNGLIGLLLVSGSNYVARRVSGTSIY